MEGETKEHRHCIVCGKVIPSNEYFCSEECESNFQEHNKGIKRKRTIITAIFIIMLVVFLIIVTIA